MERIASYLDHTLLKADATPDKIDALCEQAKKYKFASVCVNSCYARRAAQNLNGTSVKVCCVVGFPLGACTSKAKAFEAADAADNGAEEIDMVINVGQLKAGNLQYVRDDISAVVNAVAGRAVVKVIIEACLLDDQQKTAACRAAMQAGASRIGTSNGPAIADGQQ